MMSNTYPFEVTFRVLLGRAQDTLPKLNGGRLTQVQEYIVSWGNLPTDTDRQHAADGIKEWLTSFGYSVIAVKWLNHQSAPTPVILPPFNQEPTTGSPPLRDISKTYGILGAPVTVEVTPPPKSPVLSTDAAVERLAGTPGYKSNAGAYQPSLLPASRGQKRWTAAEDRKLVDWKGDEAQLAADLGRTQKACEMRRLAIRRKTDKKTP